MDCSPSGGVPLGLLGMYLSGESTIRLWCSDQSYGHMMMMMMMIMHTYKLATFEYFLL